MGYSALSNTSFSNVWNPLTFLIYRSPMQGCYFQLKGPVSTVANVTKKVVAASASVKQSIAQRISGQGLVFM